MSKTDLTEREKEVADLLLQGKSNKQIALALGITERTVEFHLNHLYLKLKISSRTEAILQLGKSTGSALPQTLKESTVEKNGNQAYAMEKSVLTKPVTSRLFKTLLFTGIALAAVLIFLFIKNRTWDYEREGEFPDELTVGQTLERSNASGEKVHGQFGVIPAWPAQPGYVKYNNINIPKTDHLYLRLRYSKFSQTSVQILIYIDEEPDPRASILPKDQGDWNQFIWAEPILLGKMERGVHSIKFYTDGQEYGVADLDKFILTTEPP